MSAFPCKHLAALLTLLLGYIGGRHHANLSRVLYSLLFDAICIVSSSVLSIGLKSFFMSLIRVSLCSPTWRFYWFYTLKDLFPLSMS